MTEFNETVVHCKQEINVNAEKMISTITARKEALLQRIESIHHVNEQRFNDVLSKLQKMTNIASSSKEEFNRIASNKELARTEKRQELHNLLTFNMDSISNSDSMGRTRATIDGSTFKIEKRAPPPI